MSVENAVYFDTDKLIEGRTVKLTYKGVLATPETNEIYVHYGFGLLWDNLQEAKLNKVSDDCYEAEITLISSHSLHFCFRDDKNNWDNNEAKNYTSEISKEDVTVSKVETTSLEVPKLKKSYLIAKKLKITFYKIITYLPRMFNGSWKKRKVETDN